MREYRKSVTEYADVRICMRDIKELGIEEGILTRNVEIVKNSLQKGFSIDLISELTGLTPKQINKMR
jgi:hypothetical protein